ncbi:MAG: A/G-specific adenine glycosylase [Aestuariibaculum sp.]
MQFTEEINNWYSVNKRDLPWRYTKNPYKIWLSEIILQQTQVKQGLPYYEAFLDEYPTVFKLAKANEEAVLKLWQGLGYYSRARNLHATAKYVANELGGIFPNNYNDLLKLKGVGDYTASAIASICFGETTAVVDGNVYRVLSRYFGIDTPINTPRGAKEFKTLAQELIDKDSPATFNQAVMEFGATQCTPKNPNCGICVFNTGCTALKEDKVAALPIKIKSAKIKKLYFNFLVILSEENNTVIEKRTENGIWRNLYQFPLIETKKEVGFDVMQKLVKEHVLLKDKLFSMVPYNDKAIVHKLSHRHLHTKFWIIKTNNSIKSSIPIESIHDFAVPVLIGNFIESFNF